MKEPRTVARRGSLKEGDMHIAEDKTKNTSLHSPRQQLGSVSLVEIASRYTDLKRRGRRWMGLCPLHSEKTASFTVDEEKQLFFCFGCQQGGDAINFIRKIEGVSFREALAILGLVGGAFARPRRSKLVKNAERAIAQWRQRVSNQIAAQLRAISLDLSLAFVDPDLRRAKKREWEILSDLHDDLWVVTIEIWKERRTIEGILCSEPEDPTAELLVMFPLWTSEYQERLQAYVRGDGEVWR